MSNTISELNRRVGRFTISASALRDQPEQYIPLFANCIVVRAEMIYWHDRIEYTALSPEFEIVPNGFQPPDYTLMVTTTQASDETLAYSFAWQKLSCSAPIAAEVPCDTNA